ncbi:MAG: serine/threonine-protein kinase [Pseudomonadota bacterium]
MSEDDFEKQVLDALTRALEQPSDSRKAWLETEYADQIELQARVLKLLDGEESASARLRTGGARSEIADPVAPERVGNYKILDLIGQGGMGAVYKGQRDTGDFDHVAAIKVIRPGLLSETLRERFQRERQTLANLNHPGIANLFDGGTLEDGSPYFVMELVEGISLGQWIEEQPRAPETILDCFEGICDAVAYAHQHLIVHRDLTPSNVLISDTGMKLIDFGIAKPQSVEDLDVAAGSPSLASLSFTPGFAAPERSQGAPANTLSDVYSLGKLLEAMLGPDGVDADLSAIINTAAAQAPEARYVSVDALKEDIRKYRQGYPVSARHGTSLYRFGKFFGRRRLLLSFATLSVAALVTAFAVTLFQYQRAEAALERANARFEQARTLSRNLLFEAYDEFAQVSGTLEPRQNLADLLTGYVAQLAEDDQAPDDVLFDVGQFNSRLADIYGGLGMANLGDTDRSLELLTDANQAFERLLEKDPGNTAALAEQIFVQRGLTMQHLIYRIDPETALEYNQGVLEAAARGVAIGDENERTLLRHFWSARTDRLQVLRELQDYQTGLAEVQAWQLELTPELNERFGGGGEEMSAYMAMQEAEFLNLLERPEGAIAPLRKAEAIRLEFLETSPENYYHQTQLLVIYMELSRALDLSQSFEQAITESGKGIALAREILAQDPSDAAGPEGLNSALQNHTAFLVHAGREQEAIATATEALGLARDLDGQFPDNPYYQQILMNSIFNTLEAQPETPGACTLLDEASALYASLNAAESTAEGSLSRAAERQSELTQTLTCN